MAPEVCNGEVLHTAASYMAVDVWSLGVVLYRLLCGNVSVAIHIIDGKSAEINVPTIRGVGENKTSSPSSSPSSGFALRCRDLVRTMLLVRNEQRIGLQQIMFHSAFNVSIAADMVFDGNVFTREDKVSRIRQSVKDLRKKQGTAVSSSWILMVSRASLVREALMRMAQKSRPSDVLRKMHVSFVGEAGVDAGGLRRDLYQSLLERVCDPNHKLQMFETRGGVSCLPAQIDTDLEPSERTARLRLFEGLGRALLK
jgi:serine/threonine protein kinase